MSEPAPAVVLVVEDEPILRLHATDVLEDAGFRVVDAGSADAAVAILEVRTDVRVVFTDIDMPGSMDGMRLAAAVRDRWPPIEIIVTSGYRTPAVEAMPARSIFLSKPVDGAKLIRSVRDFLGGLPALRS